MSDIGGGDRVDRRRDEGVYADRVEREKKEKEKFKHIPSVDKQILCATFFSYLKKLFNTFSPEKQLAGKVVDLQTIIDHLRHLKTILEKLQSENLSNSPDYAAQLSEIWILLIEDFDHIEIMERKKIHKTSRFRELIDKIKNYPPDSEHHFGYYLLRQAGKDWLPFPFIEILEKLHEEHKEDALTSTLSTWSAMIDAVIENLKSSLPFKTF